MGQDTEEFMDRAEGIRLLNDAAGLLGRANRALHERAEGRDNLIGSTSVVLGGLEQAVTGLAEMLIDGITKPTLESLSQ